MARRILGLYAGVTFVFLYLPIAVVVALAFNKGDDVLHWEGFSVLWFGRAMRDPTITDPLKTSAQIALGSAALAVVLGTTLALAVSQLRPIVRAPIDAFVYVVLVTPEIIFGISLLILFVQAGIPLGIETIMVSHVVFSTSVVALIVRARLIDAGHDLEEASYDLGVPPLKTFMTVTLRRLAPAILAGGLLAFTFSFDDFITSFFVSGSGSTTLPLRIFSSLRFGVSPVVNAAATIILVVTVAAVVFAYLVLRRTESRVSSANEATG